VIDILKIFSIFAIILILLRKRLDIGYVMLIASALLFLLYRMSFASVWETCKVAALSSVTIKLILALSFIRIFEMILREHAVLTRMMDAVKAIFRNRKVVTASMPLLIGLLPSIGGAYFSCPMVDEATKDMKMTREEKGFVNYWMRHPWEYILPLYPGILLASAVTNIELNKLITVNLVYAIFIIITAIIFGMRGIKGVIDTEEKLSKKGLWSFMPIVSVLLLVFIADIGLHFALIAVVIVLLIFFRYRPRAIFSCIKHGFSRDVIILILSVMLFKEAMEASGAVTNVSQFFINEGIPVFPILFLLPFITGILTGLTIGFVGSTFPLLMSLVGNSSISAISFAFASGFLGVLLSPVHICLILTKEYFKADLWGIYKMAIPASFIVFCVAVVEYMILK